MKKTWYDREEDTLNIGIKKGIYWKSIELPSGIVIDVTKDGTILSLEIPRASQQFSHFKKVLSRAELKITA